MEIKGKPTELIKGLIERSRKLMDHFEQVEKLKQNVQDNSTDPQSKQAPRL